MSVSTTKSGRVGRPPNPERQERRRIELLEVATTLFSEQGFASADVQEIADRAGVGKGTVYRYFPSKEELFLSAVDLGMRRLRQSVDSSVSEITDPLKRIAEGIRAYLTFFDEHPEVVELLIHERAHFRDRQKPTYFVHRDANIKRWQVLFQSLMEAGVIRQLPIERVTNLVSDLVYGTMFTNYFAGRQESLRSQSENILDIVFRGLLLDPSTSLID